MDTALMRRKNLTVEQQKDLLLKAADYIDKIRGIGPNAEYGCHCDLEPGMKPDSCVMDSGHNFDCIHAEKLEKQNKGKQECEYWKAIKYHEV